MKIHSSKEVASSFNLSVQELYRQFRTKGIIYGPQNKPTNKLLDAGYFVDRRKSLCLHVKIEVSDLGLDWLKNTVGIVPGSNEAKRECHRCKRKKQVSMVMFRGLNRRTCDACQVEIQELKEKKNRSMVFLSTDNAGVNGSYYGAA